MAQYCPPLPAIEHCGPNMLTWLTRDDLTFPALDRALRDPNGLLAAGGDLSPERLIAAYRHGCFPWYEQGQPILWWAPDPRMVLPPAELNVSRSLRKVMRQGRFTVTLDRDFPAVIRACAAPRTYAQGTWITPAIEQAYIELHKRGIAHSVEAWQGDELVGGLYGLAIGQLFFGESMFSRVTDASKVAFATLAEHLHKAGFVLIDCQMHTRHLESLGAREISRAAFTCYLKEYLDTPAPLKGAW
jgi:leucyl/phenylalanyl-tRNA--protein transferase